MYMKPTRPDGGAACVIHACAQPIAAWSMHIGSGPGVVGLSGMHVKPPVPLRRVRILPSLPETMMVAVSATLRGAADIALLIIAMSDADGFGAGLGDAADAE